ncbi:MAG TPA: TetR/AcrR family transcriptional regulator [Solirubrobacterales bacterium]|nr:TetR/AcrR family transcriptional regulator [Solirubrobacterales bacterium]
MDTPPKKPRRRLKPKERRELILEGAVKLFAENGYTETTMAQIAGAAEITPAVIYDHFPSKAALAIELLERHTTELLGFVGQALDRAAKNPAAQMRAGVEAFFIYVEEHRVTWRVLFRDPPPDAQVAAVYRRLNREATAGIAIFLERGDQRGALASYGHPGQAAEMFAEAVKAAQNGLAEWWYDHPEVPREQIVERLLEFAWNGLEQTALSGDGESQ